MNKSETAKIMSILKVAYPRYYEGTADINTAVNLWTRAFAEYDYNIVETAVTALILTNKFPPTIADVMEKVVLITTPQSMNEAEAWSYVRKAISNSGYNSREEFEKLPDDCKAVVCAPEQLKAWALMDEDEVNTVIASNFQRAYRARVKQQNEFASLPPAIREIIGGVTQKMMEAQNE